MRMSHLCSSPPLRSWLLWMPSTWNWGACGKRFLSCCQPAVWWCVCPVCPYLYCPQAGREYGRVQRYHRQGPGSHSQTSLLLIHRGSGKRCRLLMLGAVSARRLPSADPLADAYEHCAALARAYSRDQWLGALYASANVRGALFALASFDYEIRHALKRARDPHLAAMRLAWWRAVIAGERQ